MAERSGVETRQLLSASNALPPLPKESEPLEGSRRRSGGPPKRKATNSSSSAPSKRFAKERAPPILPLHNGPCTRARQSPNKFPRAAAAATPAKPEGPQLPQDVAEVPDKVEQKPDPEDQTPEPLVDTELEAVRSRDANVHVIPVTAGWFSWTKVHPLEEQALSSFFNGKSESQTSEKYLELRNLIMKKYHANPQSQISVKDLADLNVADAKERWEIMEFLSHWGLINFHPFPPHNTVAASNGVDENSEVKSLAEKLYQFRMHPVSKVGLQKGLPAPTSMHRILPESTIPDVLLPQEGPAVEYHCNSCSADCSRKRYHCQKQADFDLCPECYNDGKFGSGMTSADFILMEPGTEMSGTSSGSWTDQETLLLLEALELYGENWNEIAEHVATKTKAQCFLHFVRMPIEDMFLEGEDTSDITSPEVPDLAAVTKDPPALKSSSDLPKTASEQPDTASEQPTTDSEPPPAKSETTDKQPPASPSDAVKPTHAGHVDDPQANVDNFAIDALKAAFQAVGATSGAGGSLSSAEAGNPVMALVGYLAALVDADVSDASIRSSLRALSEDSPGIQLASRHCFFLEDPPDSSKDSVACESTVEMVDAEPQKEEKETLVMEGSESCKESTNKNGEDMVLETTDASVPSKECKEIPHVATESSELASTKEATSTLEATKPLDVDSNSVHPEEEGAQETVSSDQTVETGSSTVENEMKATRTAQETDASSCKVEEGMKESKVTNEISAGSTEQKKDDTASSKIKRAAVAAISAAAVKAKLLADQEEEQIRQLCSFVIERQLHKLETKLGLFTDMERVFMRVREQIDRTRQRLMLERNQIIAARFGLPTTIPRMAFQSTPTSRASLNNMNNAVSNAPGSSSPKSQVKGLLKA